MTTRNVGVTGAEEGAADVTATARAASVVNLIDDVRVVVEGVRDVVEEARHESCTRSGQAYSQPPASR